MSDNDRKGIILAGGTGSRLFPITLAVSKQLLPVYDKPLIYYSISTLMYAGIKEILIISTPHDIPLYKKLLSDGSQWGVKFSFEIQKEPKGIAEAFIIGQDFIGNSNCVLILGDNIFFGETFIKNLKEASSQKSGASIFAFNVSNPSDYGVVEFKDDLAISIEEKPKKPKSSFAVPGIYFYDNYVIEIAKNISPSARGELEITDINNWYLSQEKLFVKIMEKGTAWLDAGTPQSMIEAGQFIEVIEKRQGIKIMCPEEVAWQAGLIDDEKLIKTTDKLTQSEYGKYLRNLLNN